MSQPEYEYAKEAASAKLVCNNKREYYISTEEVSIHINK
jgi:hypothetical protein